MTSGVASMEYPPTGPQAEPDIVDCPKCAGHGLLKAEHAGRLVVFECADCGGQGWAAVAALEPKS
jgi:DnaJ-class molecular chaperone